MPSRYCERLSNVPIWFAFYYFSSWVLHCLAARARAHSARVRLALIQWFNWMRAGCDCRAAILDKEEGLFGDVDLAPKERVSVRSTLRSFLEEGQVRWAWD